MATSPESPLRGLFAGLSADQLIAEEQEHRAAELSTPSVLGKRPSPPGDSDDNSDSEHDKEPPSQGHEHLPSSSTSATHPNPGSLLMEQAMRRTVKRLKLPNEDISLVEKFVQASIVNLVFVTND